MWINSSRLANSLDTLLDYTEFLSFYIMFIINNNNNKAIILHFVSREVGSSRDDFGGCV